MTVRKHSDGKWLFDIYIQNYNGERKRIRKYGFKTKKEATELERVHLNTINNIDTQITLKRAIDEYLLYNQGRVKQLTITVQEGVLRVNVLSYFGDNYVLNNLKKIDVIKWQQRMIEDGKTTDTINRATIYFKTMYSLSKDNYGLKHDPFKNIKKYKKDHDKQILIYTKEEFEMFIRVVDDIEYEMLYRVLYFTGMRIGEALALNWNDFDEVNNTLKISKSASFAHKGKSFVIGTTKNVQSNRVVAIPNHLVTDLKKLKSFYTQYGPVSNNNYILGFEKPINYNTLRFRHNGYTKESKLHRIKIHDFRHSHASLLINLGAPIVLISKRLGHKNTSTTLNVYSHMFKSTEDEILKLL